MTAPDNHDFDKDAHPKALPDNRVLHPLFGTYCSTETFSEKGQKNGDRHVHYEAHLDDPVRKTWTVSKIVTDTRTGINPYRPKVTNHVHPVKAKVNFREAAGILADFERDCLARPATFGRLYPDAPAMGFLHFKAFAEREGYVFDTQGKPHARPNLNALPLGCSFYQEDVDSASRHVERPADEFDNNGPASKLPNTHFLFDQFTQAVHRSGYSDSLNGLRALSLLDRFADLVDEAHGHLSEYCEKYSQLGYGGLIDDALGQLDLAESALKQLKAYNVDTTEYDSFLLQCRITCHVLHAEGLYDLMNKGLGDFDANEAAFRKRTAEALAAFSKIDSSEAGHKTLQNMIVQSPEPKVPDAIGHFIRNYRAERKKFGASSPPPPKP